MRMEVPGRLIESSLGILVLMTGPFSTPRLSGFLLVDKKLPFLATAISPVSTPSQSRKQAYESLACCQNQQYTGASQAPFLLQIEMEAGVQSYCLLPMLAEHRGFVHSLAASSWSEKMDPLSRIITANGNRHHL